MPFTPSHIAAVLPFARTPLLPAGLVVGSVTPDLFYFLPVDVDRGFSHSVPGALTLDLGVGLVVLALWQLVFRRPATDYAPFWLRSRLPPPAARLTAGYLGLSVASVLVGIATHLVWDTVTHLDRSDVLRHASSALGAVVLVVWFVRWARLARVGVPERTRLAGWGRVTAWSSVVGVSVGAGALYWAAGQSWPGSPLESGLAFFTVRVVVGCAGLVAVAACLAWWILPARSR